MTDSNDGQGDFSKTYRTPFGTEVDSRETHLAALPGKVCSEWLDSLNRASEVFGGNGVELERHLTAFVGTPTHVSDLPDGFDVAANRLLHNYLASLATLRDVQRMVHHKLWPARHAPENANDKRTVWEVTVWEPKRDEAFGDDQIKFLVDLRNFSVHYAIPPIRTGTRLHWDNGGEVMHENSVLLDRTELLKWSGWKGPSRRHIESYDGDIEFLPAIADYSTRVREFYGWFWEQVTCDEKVRLDLAEYHGTTNEYMFWRKVESTFSHFGPDGPSVYKPRLAAARLERAAFGTSGWRAITPDESGAWEIGETDWPPLPSGPR